MTRDRLLSRLLVLSSVACLFGSEATAARAASADPHPTVIPARGTIVSTAAPAQMPAAFTANRGQWPDSILFRADAGGATLWLTRTGIYYQFTTRIQRSSAAQPASEVARLTRFAANGAASCDSFTVDMIKVDFLGSNSRVRVEGVGALEYKCNYFLRNDPAHWQANVPTYAGVVFKDLYPGVDLKYSLQNGRLEHELVSRAGADPSKFKLHHVGSTNFALDQAGNPVLAPGPQKESADGFPMAVGPGAPITPSDPDFSSTGSKTRANVLSPNAATVSVTLTYSTYLGGTSDDAAYALDVDNSGRAYVTGFTTSSDFPTLTPFQTYQGAHDVFVTKLNAAGNAPLYSTYIGGSGDDDGVDLAVDNSGSVYVAGITSSADFPILSAFQSVYQGGFSDAFVIKLTPAGSTISYSTYLGGADGDICTGLAVDGLGHAYVTGTTYSADFPVLNPYQTDQFDVDLFVTKLSVAGDLLSYSTYLGGSGEDYGAELSVDITGSAFVTGVTWSPDFPTQNPIQAVQGAGDMIVAKLNPTGDALVYSTYLGGSDEDDVYALDVDAIGNAYVAGYTVSSNFPTLDPYQSFQGVIDAFVAKLNPAGNALLYSTYLGGSDSDYAYAIAVDGLGNAYVAGRTSSGDFPTQSPYQTNQPDPDAFVVKLGSSGNNLAYATYLGGSGVDYTGALAVNGLGSVYLAGTTYSADFPTQNPYLTYQGSSGLRDGFVANLSDQVTDILKFILYSPVDMIVTDPAGDSIGIGFNTILHGSTYDTLLDVNGDLDPDDSVTIPNPIAGPYRVRVIPEAGASGSDKFTLAIRINGNQQLIPDGYRDQLVSALGTTVPDTLLWIEATTLPGDCDANGTITSADIIFLVNYVFKSGAEPVVSLHGDVNCDGLTTSADIIYLVNYVFKSSISPCSQSGG